MEQFVRCYALEPFNFFKVVPKSEFKTLPTVLKSCLNCKGFPNKNSIDLNGVRKSYNAITENYH